MIAALEMIVMNEETVLHELLLHIRAALERGMMFVMEGGHDNAARPCHSKELRQPPHLCLAPHMGENRQEIGDIEMPVGKLQWRLQRIAAERAFEVLGAPADEERIVIGRPAARSSPEDAGSHGPRRIRNRESLSFGFGKPQPPSFASLSSMSAVGLPLSANTRQSGDVDTSAMRNSGGRGTPSGVAAGGSLCPLIISRIWRLT